MIADTDFLIDLARSNSNAVAKVEELIGRKEPLAITVITLFEMWQGAGKLKEREQKLLSGLIDRAMVIMLESENARVAGLIQYGLRKKGMPLSPPDALIAGIVLDGTDTLLTRNVKDFSRVANLKYETY